MSQRVKRPNRSDDGSVPVKRRKRPTAEEEETASLAWQPRLHNDLKSIYNRTTTEAPAELFRKDLISAMKLPDSEPLANDEYWVIVDQWKQEWERGVQVPVNPDSLPEPSVTVTHCGSAVKSQQEFRLPKNKYIRITKDDNFKIEEHVLSSAPAQAEAACSYDLDECDVAWLKLLNGERAAAGLSSLTEDQLERILERLELRCWDKIQSILRNEEGLGIEYDENVICDVCRSPDSEEGNEMVFCDSCNICVHQACYGITRIPDGQWLCCTCALSQRPDCVLCPNKGGAMKCTRSGQKWAHVSCALWIPEVSIGCVEKMEPITKISSIPQSRWALICVLCRERVGACIQCSVKTCKTAYHVTCAFKHGLEMRAIIEDENADDGVKLRSYCEKHSKSSKKDKSVCSGSEDDDCKRKKRKDMTSEEKNQARAQRLQEIEAEFYKHVNIKDISVPLDVDSEALQYVYNYWKLKRKGGHNKPLLPPKSEDVDMLSHKQEQADLEKMKMFVQLRQDLERVRNLCYMVSRREKLSRTFFRMREQTFYKQAAVLTAGGSSLASPVVQAVIQANHGPTIYDRLYSFNEAEDHTTDFDTVLARIGGTKSPKHEANDERKPEINGLFKDVKNSPYEKHYFNGSKKRDIFYGSGMSSSSADEQPKENKENRLHTSSENDKSPTHKKKLTVPRKNSKAAERRRKRLSISNRQKLDSSSEDDIKPSIKPSRLKQMEKEFSMSGSDTDDLVPIRTTSLSDVQHKLKPMSAIYSDSDSSDVSMKNDDKSSNAASDSQQNRLRTKASVKEFSQKPSTSKANNNNKPPDKKKKTDECRKEQPKKKDYVPSDLIVPQRQAAKIASENLKSTTSRVKEQQPQPSTDHDHKILEKKTKTKTKAINKLKESNSKDIPQKEMKENKKELLEDINRDKDNDKFDQDLFPYVPQRQAAIKAAEHIKSGLGKPVVNEVTSTNEVDKSKKNETENKIKKDEHKVKKEIEIPKPSVIETKRKSSSNSSSSSSSMSSTDSSSTSSTDSEEEVTKSQSENKRPNAKDWPFLDKESKSAASSAFSDSSEQSSPTTATSQQKQQQQSKSKTNRKDKNSLEREESIRSRGRPSRGRPKHPANTSDRMRDVISRSGNITDTDMEGGDRNKYNKGKEYEDDEPQKEIIKSNKLLSPIRKEDKRLSNKIDNEVSNLEKEILERKAGREGYNCNNKVCSTFDLLFGSPDKKINTNKSQKKLTTVKVSKLSEKCNKSPEKLSRSPEKNKDFVKNSEMNKHVKTSEKSTKSSERLNKIEKLSKHDDVYKSNDKIVKSSKGTDKILQTEKNYKSPKFEKTKSPKYDKPKSPKIDRSKSPPKFERSKSPYKFDRSKSPPKFDRIKSPKLERSRSPKIERCKTPDFERSKSPKYERTKSQKQDRSKSPKFERSKTPNKTETSSTKSPSKFDRSKSPKFDRTKSPKFERTKSPKLDIKSPKIEEQSRHHRSRSPKSKSPIKESKETHVETKSKNLRNKTLDDLFVDKLLAMNEKAQQDKSSKKKSTSQKSSTNCYQEKYELSDNSKKMTNKPFELSAIDNNMHKDLDLNKVDLIDRHISSSRSIFSPQPLHTKDDLLDIDNILEDDFGMSKDEELTKGPLGFSFTHDSSLVKEDSKEDRKETLDLVKKLRMGLSKKSTTYDVDDTISIASSTKNDNESAVSSDFTEQIVPNNVMDTNMSTVLKEDVKLQETPQVNLNVRVELSDINKNESNVDNYHYNTLCEVQNNSNAQLYIGGDRDLQISETDERWLQQQQQQHLQQQQPIQESYSNDDNMKSCNSQYLQQFPDDSIQMQESSSVKSKIQLFKDVLKKSPAPVHDRQLSQTPFMDQSSMDVTSSSPYGDLPPHKWNESQLMVTRRSSSSSAISQSSNGSRRNEIDDEMLKKQESMLISQAALDMTYGVLPTYPPNVLETFPPFSESSQFVNPVSLFPPPNTQLSFPSPGTALFPPAYGTPFSAPHTVMPPIPKPVDDGIHYPTACTAAFTSSQHNMALTAAMVNMPPKETQEEEIPAVTPQASTPQEIPPDESPATSNNTPNHVEPSPNPSVKSNSSTGKKSPSKPTRASARVMSNLNKSPSKSPGKSPRQESISKVSNSNRSRNDNKRGSTKLSSGRTNHVQSRNRGRGRGRGKSYTQQTEYTNTIHNNLAGTVYDLDFDEDISNDNMADLRALRERRKSSDIHERKDVLHVNRDLPQSPKFASPKTRAYNADLSELRPPTPIDDMLNKNESVTMPSVKTFPDMVQPVLPGPVDMRTYNSNFETQSYNETNLLGAFGSGAPEQQVHDDIDEELEKEFQNNLTASLKKADEPPQNIKVSLSDARNQLKVKIKGPIANYTSSVQPLPPVVDPNNSSMLNSTSNNAINNTNANPTTNLRRMRKKELLRQYVSQDMNMDEPGANQGTTSTPSAPPISRTIITIPKAVASMTTIPTKDDYRDYRFGVDEIIDTKHRKESKARPGGLSRELKHLDISVEEDSMDRRRSLGLNSMDATLKRRGRPPRPQQTTPKLKIKIGGNSIVGTKIDDKRDRIRPPKKRLSSTMAMPSVEDLKRESMKFRKRVMADFDEEKRKKKDKSEKRKKKKRKQELQIITNESDNPTKLIIRFGKKTDSDSDRTNLDNINDGNNCVTLDITNDLDDSKLHNVKDGADDNGAIKTKITPIKLKISRCQEGSGYVMKTDDEPSAQTSQQPPPKTSDIPSSAITTATTTITHKETFNNKNACVKTTTNNKDDTGHSSETQTTSTTAPLPLNISEITHTPTPLPLNKDCEVR